MASSPQEGYGAEVLDAPASPIERLFVTTKAPHVAEALRGLRPRLHPHSVVVLLVNGTPAVAEELRASVFPESSTRPQLIYGSTTHGVFRTAPFRITHAGQGACIFGDPTGAAITPQARATLDALSAVAGLNADTTLTPEDFNRRLFTKFVVNCCLNPVSALLQCRNGGLLSPALRETVFPPVIAECRAVLGTDLLPSDAPGLLKAVCSVAEATAMNKNSMLCDVLARAPTEVDYLNGYVVRRGAALGIPTPHNAMLRALVTGRSECAPHHLLPTPDPP